MLSLLSYISHLVLDMATIDKSQPYGIPLYWPFSEEHLRLPWQFLGGVKHGIPGDDLNTFINQVLSWHNLKVIFTESLIFVPFFVAIAFYTKRRV